MDLSLIQGAATIVLNGSGAAAPLRAGRIEFSQRAAVLEIALDGTAAQIASFQQGLEKALYLSGLYAGLPGEDWGYLCVTLPDSSVWRSPVQSGRCSGAGRNDPGVRKLGTQGLRVELALADYWESDTLTDVPLSNKNGANVSTGLLVNNHDDAGHDNFVNISASAILGDIPAPAVISLASQAAGLDVMLSQMLDYPAAFVGALEGEDAAVGGGVPPSLSVASDPAGCSFGSYAAVSWSGTGEAALVWYLDGSQAGYFGGRIFRPVARLRDPLAVGEKVWASWCTASASGGVWNVLMNSDGVVLPSDARLAVFPPLAVPPWPRPPAGFGWEPLALSLSLLAEGSGAHALNLDFVQFLPCDGWVRFLPIVTGLATQVRYECGAGLISRSSTAMASHAPDGPGLWLVPGLNQRIYFLSQAAPLADIGTAATLKLQYRARKRVL